MTTNQDLHRAFEGRHPSVQHFAPLFDFEHLPEPLQTVSLFSAYLAEAMLREIGDGPELSAGLRHLLQAKDCFVRQAVLDGKRVSNDG